MNKVINNMLGSGTHKGHRERMRQRLLGTSNNDFSDEFLLEMLLMYAIPQKDVAPLSKELIEKFGSLHAVLQQSPVILMETLSIKDNTAALLKLVHVISSKQAAVNNFKHTETEQLTLFSDILLPTLPHTSMPGVNENSNKLSLFANALAREVIKILPKLGHITSWEVLKDFIKQNLQHSSDYTRTRYARYIISRFFPSETFDHPLISFAQNFGDTQDFRDVCYYRFLKAEPLLVFIINNLLFQNISRAVIERKIIQQYLDKLFPGMKSTKKCLQAIADILSNTRIATVSKTEIIYRYRDISLFSFAFILHSEFPEPGMYDFSLLTGNNYIKAMLWQPEKLVPMMYELRNKNLISKISDIDGIRQFTTKYTLSELVQRIIQAEVKQ